jgi:hypothetical protein
MVYYRSHRRDNSSSALSFTSSTASATSSSFASSDDPTGYSSLLLSARNIFESVYRCDSAAVIDGASKCGSVANQALYQGVEVVLKTTTCSSNYGTNLKDSMASKPFFEYQCFCDDDDFASTCIGEDRNERNPSNGTLLATDDNNNTISSSNNDDDVRTKAANEGFEEAVTIRRSKWTAHTQKFYSKISSPSPRVVTTLSDVTTVSSSISPRRRLSIETVSSSFSTANKNKSKSKITSTSMHSSPEWVPRMVVSESREE